MTMAAGQEPPREDPSRLVARDDRGRARGRDARRGFRSRARGMRARSAAPWECSGRRRRARRRRTRSRAGRQGDRGRDQERRAGPAGSRAAAPSRAAPSAAPRNRKLSPVLGAIRLPPSRSRNRIWSSPRFRRRVADQRDGADERHEAGRHACAHRPRRPRGRSRTPGPAATGDRRQDEAERRQRVHGDAAGQDALEDGEIELPSDEDRPADPTTPSRLAARDTRRSARPACGIDDRPSWRSAPARAARRPPVASRRRRRGAAARCARASARAPAGTAWSGSRSPPRRSRPLCSRRPLSRDQHDGHVAQVGIGVGAQRARDLDAVAPGICQSSRIERRSLRAGDAQRGLTVAAPSARESPPSRGSGSGAGRSWGRRRRPGSLPLPSRDRAETAACGGARSAPATPRSPAP